MSDMKMPELLTYWKKVKETIHVFDKIVVQYVVQWSAVMLGMIGAGALIYPTSSLIAGTISLTAIVVSIPIGVKCYFYYQLLEESLLVAIEMEKLIFKDEANRFGITHRLRVTSTRKYLDMTFFGWTIFLPFVILAASSSTLSLFYFHIIQTPSEILLWLFGILGFLMVGIFFLGFITKFRRTP